MTGSNYKPGDTVRWFRGTSGVVLEGTLIEPILEPGECLRHPEDLLELGPYPTCLWSVRATRTVCGRPWPNDRGDIWNVTEAEMRFEAVRPLRTLEEARLTRPVFDADGNMIAGGKQNGVP